MYAEERPCKDTLKVSHLEGKEGGIWSIWTHHHLDLGFLASKTVKKHSSDFEATQHLVFCYGRPNKLIQMWSEINSCSEWNCYNQFKGNLELNARVSNIAVFYLAVPFPYIWPPNCLHKWKRNTFTMMCIWCVVRIIWIFTQKSYTQNSLLQSINVKSLYLTPPPNSNTKASDIS